MLLFFIYFLQGPPQQEFDKSFDANKQIGNYLEIISILMNNGLSLDDPDDDGITPEELITDRNMKAAVLALAKKVFSRY